jgi:phage terminase large subunit-like protein
MYPDEGSFRRELYPKHIEFFRAGKEYRERCFMAANRIGKTEGAGGYELTRHLTGQYPSWWEGKIFREPISAWAAGTTNETTRDILQKKLFGPVIFRDGNKTVRGSGLVPREAIGRINWKMGVQDMIDTVEIKHVSGYHSVLSLKSYQQGRKSFEGTEQHVILLDEEPPLDIYNECTIRTATVGGVVMLTFTPLEGATDTVLAFMPPEMLAGYIEAVKKEFGE